MIFTVSDKKSLPNNELPFPDRDIATMQQWQIYDVQESQYTYMSKRFSYW